MKLWRIGPPGAEKPLATVDNTTYDVSVITDEFDAEFFASDGLAKVREAITTGNLPTISVDDSERIAAPLSRPQAIICIGQNYAAHAAESGAEPPAQPIIFFKHPNTIAGPNDQAFIPKNSTKTDWEVELGVVIGTQASYLTNREQAAQAIAGYVLANDLSERDFQLHASGGQWSKGKVAPGFTPLGPWFVTADTIDPHNLTLTSRVNGEPRQHSNTSDMIFSVEDIVLNLSQHMILSPGDIILTGTPQGVALSGRFPYLRAGDVVEVAIDGLGRQRQEFVNA